jgi:hypothetical protein
MIGRSLNSRLQRRVARPPYKLRLAGVRGSIGLGWAISRLTSRLGVRSCAGCARRAERLDRVLVFAPREHRAALTAQSACWFLHGRCTGFGSRQCVTAPESQSPDAATVEQCCGGWFQYPWIEVCPDSPATSGCGFCLW